MDKLLENQLRIFQSYIPLKKLNGDDLQGVLNAIVNLSKCGNQYFQDIRDHMIKYYIQNEESVYELLTLLDIITSICFNLIKTPWRKEFGKLRVIRSYFPL
jgi:hypothetical protein